MVETFETNFLCWVFLLDNNPKYISKPVTEWIKQANIKLLNQPSEAPKLNPTKNVCAIVENQALANKPTYVKCLLFWTICSGLAPKPECIFATAVRLLGVL
ncbi:hypothetical protein XENORESO_013355 [Xenotaenia resolanae]|uniref:Transposase n=1 Tax=Xenotaenia resolanae TaxID=208358 RepID=A0ABV0X2E7_9TELE